jgi:hypothetical protein
MAYLKLCLLVLTAAAPLSAQYSWTVTSLTPSGTNASMVYGTNASTQAGLTKIGDASSAALWSGSAASYVNLAPSGSTNSFVAGMNGSQQVGAASIPLQNAALSGAVPPRVS